MQTALLFPTAWSQAEFAKVNLGDKRRSKRLVQLARRLSLGSPGPLLSKMEGLKEAKAAYRLLDSPEATHAEILSPHYARVREECCRCGERFLIEDRTTLNYTSHQHAVGLGAIGDGKDDRGLHVHNALVVEVERWSARQEPQVTVTGLLHQHVWTRPLPAEKTRKKETQREHYGRWRESQLWAGATPQVGNRASGSRLTLIADRDSDGMETMDGCCGNNVDFLIRSKYPRKVVGTEASLWEMAGRSPVKGTMELSLRGRPAKMKRVHRNKKGKSRYVLARPAQKARTVRLEVRACTVEIMRPYRPKTKTKAGVAEVQPRRTRKVNVVWVREIDPPANSEPIHWVLLTSWGIDTLADCLRAVHAYACRWLIEEYHKALKTGMGMERSQLETRERLEALLAIAAVAAVRLLSLKLLARTRPHQPLQNSELDAAQLAVLTARHGRPSEGWTYEKTLRMVAMMGGFPGRKGDGSPGWQTIWRGWNKLQDLADGYRLNMNDDNCG